MLRSQPYCEAFDATQDKEAQAFVARHWVQTKHANGQFSTKILSDENHNEGIQKTRQFLLNKFPACNGRIYCFRKQSSELHQQTVLGAVACQKWKGPVPIEVVDRDVLSIGTIWGLCVADGVCHSHQIRRKLLYRAALYLKGELGCHKIVVLAQSTLEHDLYRQAGFCQKNMLTISLLDGDCFNGELAFKNGLDGKVTLQADGDGVCDEVVVDHWQKMWCEVGIPSHSLVPDMKKVTQRFLDDARRRLQYQTFVARSSSDGKVVGSVSCQVWEGPCPQPLPLSDIKMGTIWAVYVDPRVRRKGIATALMRNALKYLTEIGCHEAILIAASEAGQQVYERIGFAANNALVLDSTGIDKSEAAVSSSITTLAAKLSTQLAAAGVSDIASDVVTALVTATHPQLTAVFDHDCSSERNAKIVETVLRFQRQHDLFIDPRDNWFTQNLQRFGGGFKMDELRQDVSKLVHKFDRLAEHYDDWTIGNRSQVERFIVSSYSKAFLDTNVDTTNVHVLDLACGIGLQGQVVRLCGFKGILIGSDVSPGMIERLRQRGCYDSAFVANANSYESITPSLFGDTAPFDIVICTGALELLDPVIVLGNIAKVLHPCGRGQAWLSFQHAAEEADVSQEPTNHQQIKGLTQSQVIRLLSSVGLEAKSIEACENAFYTPSPAQDGTVLPVPYIFVVAQKNANVEPTEPQSACK